MPDTKKKGKKKEKAPKKKVRLPNPFPNPKPKRRPIEGEEEPEYEPKIPADLKVEVMKAPYSAVNPAEDVQFMYQFWIEHDRVALLDKRAREEAKRIADELAKEEAKKNKFAWMRKPAPKKK